MKPWFGISGWIHLRVVNNPIPLMEKRVLLVSAGALIVVVSLLTLAVRGLNLGIDFTGGVALEIRPLETAGESVQQRLSEALNDAGISGYVIQALGQQGDHLVRIKLDNNLPPSQLADRGRNALKPLVSEFRRAEVIGPVIGKELQRAAVLASLLALAGVFLYVSFRFQWPFALTGLAALVHDLTAILGFYALTGFEFNIPTIATLLVTAGYSINDTVVIFDRVRENLRRYTKRPLVDICNQSLMETLPRTLATTLTTALALVGVLVLGVGVVREFALALMWGLTVGTFSSVGLALPLLLRFQISRGTDI